MVPVYLSLKHKNYTTDLTKLSMNLAVAVNTQEKQRPTAVSIYFTGTRWRSFNDVITAKSLKCVLFKLYVSGKNRSIKNSDRLIQKTYVLVVKKYDFVF